MTMKPRTAALQQSAEPAAIPNGSGAAALVATSAGALFLALLSLTADKSAAVKHAMVFYTPTGPLSGVTTTAIAVWLGLWLLLDWRWRHRDLPLQRCAVLAFAGLLLTLLLTFPPLATLI
jgi:membrane associated rhomboid family serine protease